MNSRERTERNERIYSLHLKGKKTSDIADAMLVSLSTAKSVIKKMKKMVSLKDIKKQPKKTETIDVVPETKVPKQNHVLYHMKKRLPLPIVKISNVNITQKTIDDIKSSLKLGDDHKSNLKAQLISLITNSQCVITNRAEDYEYTVAVGYRQDLNSLVVVYARPNPYFEDGTNKTFRTRGYAMAMGRLAKAIKCTNHMYSYELDKVPDVVVNDLSEVVSRASRYFKDKLIESVYVYTKNHTDDIPTLHLFDTEKV